MYRFLASPRWLVIHAVAAAAATACVLLGLWQLGQFQRPATTPVDLSAAVPLGQLSRAGAAPNPDLMGRLVTASGRYDADRQVLVGDRRLEGRPGFLVLTPLVTPDGWGLIVDRGWVPTTGAAATEVPSGAVVVTGRLARSETDADTGIPPLVQPPAGRAYRINSAEFARQVPYALHEGYLSLLDQQPPAAAAPAVAAAGETGGGRWYNAGYTLQWFLFAAAALGFWVRLVLLEVRERGRFHDRRGL